MIQRFSAKFRSPKLGNDLGLAATEDSRLQWLFPGRRAAPLVAARGSKTGLHFISCPGTSSVRRHPAIASCSVWAEFVQLRAKSFRSQPQITLRRAEVMLTHIGRKRRNHSVHVCATPERCCQSVDSESIASRGTPNPPRVVPEATPDFDRQGCWTICEVALPVALYHATLEKRSGLLPGRR